MWQEDDTGGGGGDEEPSLQGRMFGERVLDAVPEAVFVFDPSGYAIWWNSHATEATGMTDAELAGADPLEFVHEDDRDRMREWFDRLLAGEAPPSPVVEADLAGATGESVPHEFAGSVLIDEAGEIQGAVLTGRDITDRRARQELERQNERLDEFASVVSHDLRNPLTVAEGYLSLAREEHDSPDLERVAEAHGRMYDLIEGLLSLAREGSTVGATSELSLADAAADAWSGIDTARGELTVEGDRTVHADPGRLRALMENLFRNSMEHGSGGTDDPEEGTNVTVRVGPLPDGFFVEDDGRGIDPEIANDVFESGVTTSASGTGFGLTIVEDIAEAHGWEIELAAPEQGRGARFEFHLPEESAAD